MPNASAVLPSRAVLREAVRLLLVQHRARMRPRAMRSLPRGAVRGDRARGRPAVGGRADRSHRLPRRRHAVAARAEDEMAAVLERAPRRASRSSPAPRSPSSAIPRACRARRLAGYRAGGREPDQPRRAEPRRPHPAAARPRCTRRARRAAAFEAAREAGFDNVSVDLIYGLPGLDGAVWDAHRSRCARAGSPTTSRPTR